MKEIWRAAFVIARRDFSAVIFSRAFILFLVGPLLPVVIGVAAGGMGDRVANEALRPVIGIVLADGDAVRLEAARTRLAQQVGGDALPEFKRYAQTVDGDRMLARKGEGIVAMLAGSLAAPRLTGKASDVGRLQGSLGLMIAMARTPDAVPSAKMEVRTVPESGGAVQQARLLTGRAAQVLLFLLTMLLAGMVLSNMVEEKTNKVIEVLAAAVPIDAIFLGKLMAMLAMSLTGIAVWSGVAVTAYMLWIGAHFPLPAPAVGWPAFMLLGVAYFATTYTLLGSLFLSIGAQAATVREVQTLSMPVSMAQLVIFFFVSSAATRPGTSLEIAAIAFPFSSPFAMIARAAQYGSLWPHLVAILWQILWVAIIIHLGVRLFRRNVLKSGSGGKRATRRLKWGIRDKAAS